MSRLNSVQWPIWGSHCYELMDIVQALASKQAFDTAVQDLSQQPWLKR